MRGRPLETLRLPHFRPYWVSNVVQFLCFQMASFTMQWLVTGLTPSRTVLGVVGFAQGGTMAALSPLAGVVVDRLPRRRILVLGRLGMCAVIVVIAELVASGRVRIWHVVVSAFVGGALASLIQPASQTYLFDIVGRGRVQGAVALNATGSAFAQMMGPALAGVLVARIGIVESYLSSAAGLLVSVVLLAAIPFAGRSAPAGGRTPWQDLREGFAYVRAHRPLFLTMLSATMAVFNGAIFAMRPIYARHVLGVGSEGFGGMAMAQGVGTVLTAVGLAWLSPVRRLGVPIVASMLGYALCLVLYSFAFSYEYLLCVELALGVTGQLWNVWAVSGVQLAVPDEMRGRVLSMIFMLAQLGFLGQPIVGILADSIGDQPALLVFGLVPTAVLSAMLLLGHRSLREL